MLHGRRSPSLRTPRASLRGPGRPPSAPPQPACQPGRESGLAPVCAHQAARTKAAGARRPMPAHHARTPSCGTRAGGSGEGPAERPVLSLITQLLGTGSGRCRNGGLGARAGPRGWDPRPVGSEREGAGSVLTPQRPQGGGEGQGGNPRGRVCAWELQPEPWFCKRRRRRALDVGPPISALASRSSLSPSCSSSLSSRAPC